MELLSIIVNCAFIFPSWPRSLPAKEMLIAGPLLPAYRFWTVKDWSNKQCNPLVWIRYKWFCPTRSPEWKCSSKRTKKWAICFRHTWLFGTWNPSWKCSWFVWMPCKFHSTPSKPSYQHVYSAGYAADWWSVGIILFELIAGIPPFTANLPEVV